MKGYESKIPRGRMAFKLAVAISAFSLQPLAFSLSFSGPRLHQRNQSKPQP
jgi:hypothetical protein